jgi:enoyl-CoA hydratase/carnithine racemase
MSPDEYDSTLTDPCAGERFAGDDATHLILVDGQADRIAAPGSMPVVVCWVGDRFGGAGPASADLVVGPEDVDGIVRAVERCPLAATALAVHLRACEGVDADRGLALESGLYSMLQSGPEFRAWRGAIRGIAAEDDEPVVTTRTDESLYVTLNRPHRHNAITAGLRDGLHDALALAVVDDSIRHVVLRGAGPSFCSGGDLAEFGSRPDPASAHVVRLARSPARLLNRLRDRLTVYVHGSTLGGGIEMAAFADRIVADPAATFGLPEVAIGLIPGAGGTISLPRRIGRQRTAALGITGRSIDTATALEWGLVDAVSPRSELGAS